MKSSKIIVYQVLLKAKRNTAGELEWEDENRISNLVLGFDWKTALSRYNRRNRFYWGFSVSGCGGDELLPVIDAKLELVKPSLENPEFTLEMATMPGKLDPDHYRILMQVFEENFNNEDFKFWWDNDPRGPRKRNDKIKKKLLDEIKKIAEYNGSDDLKLEDVAVSLEEAKIFFGIQDLQKKEIQKIYKKRLKELQLKHHPDTDAGSDELFLFLQKCRSVIENWLRK